MTTPLRDLVRGFAQDYLALSKSTVTIALPDSSANAGARTQCQRRGPQRS
ncbi:MAG: hypothetical protein KL863_19525 [Rhizobium sp.]|nr:hypothetical protein [Rhizobium sp.]